MPTKQVGLLHSGSRKMFGNMVDLAIQSANKWLVDNKSNVDVKLQPARTRYVDDDLDQLEDDADELIEEKSDIILAAGGPQSAIAARDATAEAASDLGAPPIPVVFTTVVDPVAIGLRISCDVPGGTHLTGMAGKTSENDPVRLDFLRKVLVAQGRAGTVYGVLVNPSRQQNRKQFKDLKDFAKPLGLKLIRRRASKPGAIKKAYDFFRKKNVVGVVVTADGFFNNNRTKIIEEAAAPDPANNRVGVPTIYQWKEFTDNFTDDTGVQKNGGLMSFGPSMTEAYKMAGEYIGKVANGMSPSDIKCSKPEENLIEVWINERTARHHGFDLTKIPAQLGNKTVNRRP